MEIAYSIHGVPIRLPDERWVHITENKPYMESYFDRVLEAIEEPEWVLRGYAGSQIAVIPVGRKQFLHVVYKEINQIDRFVITAYIAVEYIPDAATKRGGDRAKKPQIMPVASITREK